MNSVSFGNRVAMDKPAAKKSAAKRGASIGAGIGLGASVAGVIKQRGLVKTMVDTYVGAGMPKMKVYGWLGVGMLIGAALVAGVGSAIGAGIGKIVDHFKKPKEEAKVA